MSQFFFFFLVDAKGLVEGGLSLFFIMSLEMFDYHNYALCSNLNSSVRFYFPFPLNLKSSMVLPFVPQATKYLSPSCASICIHWFHSAFNSSRHVLGAENIYKYLGAKIPNSSAPASAK